MSRTFSRPVAVTHNGKPIFFARFIDTENSTSGIVYNILDLRIDSSNDADDWTGYRELPASRDLAPLGMSVLSSERTMPTDSLFCAVSDQTYIYVFTADEHTIFCQRYIMQENPDVGNTSARFLLNIAWQVRFQRSQSPDVPAGKKDTMGFMDMEGQPFDEPMLQLSFGTGNAAQEMNLMGGSFWVSLVPTSAGDTFRWQFFIWNTSDNKLYTYSLSQGENGLPVIDPERIDPTAKSLMPDAIVTLTLEDGETERPVTFHAPPNATVYLKQEPVSTGENGVLRMNQVQHLFLTMQVRLDDGDETLALSTFDFSVSADGYLALLEPGENGIPVERTFVAGQVGPAEYSLEFDNRSEVRLPETGGYIPGSVFTLEAWIFPTSDNLEIHGFIGGDVPDTDAPPSIWITESRRVGVGFAHRADEATTAFASAESVNSILVLHAWNHIAFTYDTNGPKLYHNAREVALTDTLDAGLTPLATSAVTRLGAGRQTCFVGMMDEVRAWNIALTATQIHARMYNEIPTAEAAENPNLQGYWRLDEGSGNQTTDLARKGNSGAGYTGTLSGPQWLARTAPVQPDKSPIAYFDDRGLSVLVGVIIPGTDELTRLFGDVAEGTRTWLLAGSDGLLHCYCEDSEGQAITAHYDTAITRAVYAASWMAGTEQGATTQRGFLTFNARQSGSAGNIAEIAVRSNNTLPMLTSLTLSEASSNDAVDQVSSWRDGTVLLHKSKRPDVLFSETISRRTSLAGATSVNGVNVVETWKGVIRDAAVVDAVLNGRAVSDPADARIAAGEAEYYDYSGKVPMAFLSNSSTPELLSYLQLISRYTGAFACRNITITGEPSADTCTVAVVTASDETHYQTETLTRTFLNVPRQIEAFLATLNGSSEAYDYTALVPADTSAYALGTLGSSSTSQELQIFIPFDLDSASFEVQNAADQNSLNCDLTIEIGLKDGNTLSGAWVNAPRETTALIEKLRQEPGDVGEYLRFLPPTGEFLVENQTVDAPISSVVFLSFWETLLRGFSGNVFNASLDFTLLQGAESTDEKSNLSQGSHLFRVVLTETPDNGYPALLTLSDTPIPLAKPGTDGGWLAESPRYAVETQNGSSLTVDTSQDDFVFTDAQSLTLEAWCRVNTPQIVFPGDNAVSYPRIIHGNPTDEGDKGRFMLGLSATNALLVVKETSVSTGDSDVTNPNLRIAAGSTYTVQAYILPDLSSTDFTNTLWTLEFNGSGTEALQLTVDGVLTLVQISQSGNSVPIITSDISVSSTEWSQVTLVRSGENLSLYVNCTLVGSAVQSGYSSTSHTIKVAGNTVSPELQFRINELAVWNRARSAGEISDDYGLPVPVDDQALVLLWPFDQNDDTIRNRAQLTTGWYDSTAVGETVLWPVGGVFYRAFATVRDAAVESRDALVAPDVWRHLTALYQPCHGVQLSQTTWANMGNDESLNVSGGLSLAGWWVPQQLSTSLSQVVFGKYDSENTNRSYYFGITSDKRPTLVVRVTGQTTGNGTAVAENVNLHTFTSSDALIENAPVQITGTTEIVEIVDVVSGCSYYSVSGQLYVNGAPTVPGPALPNLSQNTGTTYRLDVIGGSGSGRYPAGAVVPVSVTDTARFTQWISNTAKSGTSTVSLFDNSSSAATTLTMPARNVSATCVGHADRLSIATSDASATLGRIQTSVDNPTLNLPYTGLVSDLQLWSRPLTPAEVQSYVATNTLPTNRDGLVSYWPFTEQEGLYAADQQLDNNATLTSSNDWIVFHSGAGIQMMVDGHVVPVQKASPGNFDGYGVAQFSIANMRNDYGTASNNLDGQLDEIRVWNQPRTNEQITDSMHGYLTGNEPGLIGYWRFDVGSGRVVVDRSPWRHDATFEQNDGSSLPAWVTSTAPISDEAGEVRNALGGPDTPTVAAVTGAPVAVEYGDVQRDAHDSLFSVMKRLYILPAESLVKAVEGFKVGDLNLVYIGQIQSNPTLTGYIEGPPPIPSENLTRPFWYDPTKPSYLAYYGNSSVTLTESDGLQANFSSGTQQATDNIFGFSGGIALDFTTQSVIGVPPAQTTIQSSKLSGKLGGGLEFDWGSGDSESNGWGDALSKGRRYHFYNCGDWERPSEDGSVYLSSKERRFIPNNEGLAVVRSLTADLYSTHLRSTGAMVSLAVVPNTDIPEDVNLIYFPINPKYVKNGTLDGRIGLQPDPDYTDATDNYQSYFDPIQAYSLQQRIEKNKAAFQSYYTQLDATSLGKSGQTDLSQQRSEDPVYDIEKRIPRRDLVSTYVWTAAGGLYSESVGYVNTIQESFGGLETFSRTGKVNLEGSLVIGGPVGVFAEAHFNNQFTRSRSVSKDKSQTAAMSLDLAADPDGFLSRYTGGSAPPFNQPAYSADPVPGKVDTYRFKTFYLAPERNSFDDFFEKVVDQTWLMTSSDSRAAALRQAQSSRPSNGVWRVMHRVTFVSRIPPSFQVYPLETAGPTTPSPNNLEQNTAILRLIALHVDSQNPSAVQIGDAVSRVFNEDLSLVIPWWTRFREEAAIPNSEAADRWNRMRTDTLAYAQQYYDTLAVNKR